jgi:hypothetical protein
VTFDDHAFTFASKAEARHYQDLRWLMKAGKVKSVSLQPWFPLVVNGEKVALYIGDFEVVYPDGEVEIQDVKGFKTPIYRLKAKLFEACMGFSITEVKRGDR